MVFILHFCATLLRQSVYWRLASFFIFFSTVEFLLLRFISSGLAGMILTLLLIAGTGIVGAFLIRRQSLRCWQEINRYLDIGETPTMPLMNGFILSIAAVLLIVPGILSGCLGFLLLVTPIRFFVISHVVLRFEAYRHKRQDQSRRKEPDIIDID